MKQLSALHKLSCMNTGVTPAMMRDPLVIDLAIAPLTPSVIELRFKPAQEFIMTGNMTDYTIFCRAGDNIIYKIPPYKNLFSFAHTAEL